MMSGKYDAPLFVALVKAVVYKTRREADGKSMTNMKYEDCLVDMCEAMAQLSPRAYRAFSRQFAGLSIRSLR